MYVESGLNVGFMSSAAAAENENAASSTVMMQFFSFMDVKIQNIFGIICGRELVC
jgi:hypothetical protein